MLMFHFFGAIVAAIEWDKLFEGVKTAFEDGVSNVLPIAGVMLTATILFALYRRFIKKAAT
jgi:hypothetical protein